MIPLDPHQVKGVEFLTSGVARGKLLADEPGLGKTRHAFAAGLAKGEADRAALVEALEAAQGAVNAAVERTQAEYAGHDKRAERFDRVIRAWKAKRDAALSAASGEAKP